VLCPPWGEGSCEVEATSPTATQVEQERDAWSSRGWSSRYPDRCRELRANSDTAHRGGGWCGVSSGDGSWLMSLVLKLFCSPSAEDSAAQLRIRSVSSSNHRISGISAGLQHNQNAVLNSSCVIARPKSLNPNMKLPGFQYSFSKVELATKCICPDGEREHVQSHCSIFLTRPAHDGYIVTLLLAKLLILYNAPVLTPSRSGSVAVKGSLWPLPTVHRCPLVDTHRRWTAQQNTFKCRIHFGR
jgi:hypothetical protein